jgi:hypothetical protein
MIYPGFVGLVSVRDILSHFYYFNHETPKVIRTSSRAEHLLTTVTALRRRFVQILFARTFRYLSNAPLNMSIMIFCKVGRVIRFFLFQLSIPASHRENTNNSFNVKDKHSKMYFWIDWVVN